MSASLKNTIKRKPKYYTDSQLYILSLDFLINKIINRVNNDMSTHIREEFGYDLVNNTKNLIINFTYSYHSKDKENKIKYCKDLENNLLNIEIILNILEKLKVNNTKNCIGFTINEIIDLKLELGKIQNNFESWINFLQK